MLQCALRWWIGRSAGDVKTIRGSAAILASSKGLLDPPLHVNVDSARPMAAINTGLQTGDGACERGLSRLNGFWVAASACTSLKRGVSDIGRARAIHLVDLARGTARRYP